MGLHKNLFYNAKRMELSAIPLILRSLFRHLCQNILMVVQIKILVPSKMLFGAEICVEGGLDIRSILLNLASKYGEEFVTRVYDPVKDQLKPWIVILRNGRSIDFMKGKSTELRDGDRLVIMTIAAGG